MAETAPSVEKRHGFIGDGSGSNPGYRDTHAPEKRRVISGAGVDMVLAGMLDAQAASGLAPPWLAHDKTPEPGEDNDRGETS